MRDGLDGVLEAGMFAVQFICLIVSSTAVQVLGRPVCALPSRVAIKHSTPSRHGLFVCLRICSCALWLAQYLQLLLSQHCVLFVSEFGCKR